MREADVPQRRCKRNPDHRHPEDQPCGQCPEDDADKERIRRESLEDHPPGEVTGMALLIAGVLR